MEFQGKHIDKHRIIYKQEEGGFQCHTFYQDNFIYQCYMQNDPAPGDYLKQKLSPLYSCIMHLFDTLKDEYHQYSMDNLYNLTMFYKAAINCNRKLLFHGVTRKGMRGIPMVVCDN